ncbi:MAG TPA: SRPBCC family protein [Jatrophihabitans sp.]|nr:SRPBCC family protein [Jatrophihabitans sp.]
MAPFVVTHHTPLPPDEAWARIVDWPRHARYVPLTSIRVRPGPATGAGTVVNARTGVGCLGFDDPMEVVVWQPPADGAAGRCRLEKRGSVMRGWAELTVEPHGTGSRATWREEATPARLPRIADRVSTASGRWLFGRVLRHLLDD